MQGRLEERAPAIVEWCQRFLRATPQHPQGDIEFKRSAQHHLTPTHSSHPHPHKHKHTSCTLTLICIPSLLAPSHSYPHSSHPHSLTPILLHSSNPHTLMCSLLHRSASDPDGRYCAAVSEIVDIEENIWSPRCLPLTWIHDGERPC